MLFKQKLLEIILSEWPSDIQIIQYMKYIENVDCCCFYNGNTMVCYFPFHNILMVRYRFDRESLIKLNLYSPTWTSSFSGLSTYKPVLI